MTLPDWIWALIGVIVGWTLCLLSVYISERYK